MESVQETCKQRTLELEGSGAGRRESLQVQWQAHLLDMTVGRREGMIIMCSNNRDNNAGR